MGDVWSAELSRRTSRKTRRRITYAAGAAMILLGTATTVHAAVDDPSTTYSFFTNADVSRAVVDPDRSPVDLGMRFSSSRDGSVSAVRFLRAAGDRAAHRVTVWSGDGRPLGSATAPGRADAGWQQVTLPTPVT